MRVLHNDRPPFQSPSCRRSAVERPQLSDSRWSSGCRATFDATSYQALARPINQKKTESMDLSKEAMAQLRSYVSIIARQHFERHLPFSDGETGYLSSRIAIAPTLDQGTT
jgi:hypothetical protein